MNYLSRKPILITGSHRSGSTWVGKIISHAPSVAYIHEPFNLNHRIGTCDIVFKYWFSYICIENENLYSKSISDCLDFRYKFIKELRTLKSVKDAARLVRDYTHFTKARLTDKRPLVKDPIAIFSAEWLANRFGMDVVVLIRHPAAFAGSLKKANWRYPFEHFLKQPLLMDQHLNDYRSEIEEYAKNEKNIIDQSILLWNLIHFMILKYRTKNEKWNFIKHEELSRNPIDEYSKLYQTLGLQFSRNVLEKIKESSHAGFRETQLDEFKRDSKSNIWNWKNRLTSEEIQRVKEKTHEIASQFYSDEEW
jgi:hypothetical protein